MAVGNGPWPTEDEKLFTTAVTKGGSLNIKPLPNSAALANTDDDVV